MQLDFEKFITITKETQTGKLKMLPSVIYHYGCIDNELNDKMDDLKIKMIAIKSQKSVVFRAKYNRIRKAITETEIKDVIKSDESVIALEKEIIEVGKALRRSKLRMAVLDNFKEIIINYGHNIRLERKAGNKE